MAAGSHSGVTCNAKRVALTMRRVSQRFPEVMQEILMQEGEDLLEAAQWMSSLSDHTQADLDKMGNPYARAHPAPPHDPAIIHTQSGRYLKGWRIAKSRNADGGTVTLHNRTPWARYLERGSKTMIPRPLLAVLLKALRATMKTRYADATRILKALTRNSNGSPSRVRLQPGPASEVADVGGGGAAQSASSRVGALSRSSSKGIAAQTRLGLIGRTALQAAQAVNAAAAGLDAGVTRASARGQRAIRRRALPF